MSGLHGEKHISAIVKISLSNYIFVSLPNDNRLESQMLKRGFSKGLEYQIIGFYQWEVPTWQEEEGEKPISIFPTDHGKRKAERKS